MEKGSHQVLNKNYGHLISFGFVEGEPFFCIGPHCKYHIGRYFLCLFSFFLVTSLLFLLVVCPAVSSGNTQLGAMIFGFLLINYLLAAVINPGVETRKEPLGNGEGEGSENFCSECEVYREEKTEHCDDCGVCIQGYDHHCPWTSKCIGKGNICFFYNFLIGILISFIFCTGTLAMFGQVHRG